MPDRVPEQRQRGDTGREYRGASIHAGPEVHERAFELVQELLPPVRGGFPSRIVDLGAGSGAFTLRLQDAGYHVTAVDVEPPKLSAEIRFVQADLCQDFTKMLDERFDAAIAVETIEHLDCPVCFLTHAREILKPGGLIFLSTPNVTHPYSRLKFGIKGRYFGFDESSYWTTGHTTPLPHWLLTQHLRRAGFSDLRHGYGGSFEMRGARLALATTLTRLSTNLREGATDLGSVDHGMTLFLVARRPVN